MLASITYLEATNTFSVSFSKAALAFLEQGSGLTTLGRAFDGWWVATEGIRSMAVRVDEELTPEERADLEVTSLFSFNARRASSECKFFGGEFVRCEFPNWSAVEAEISHESVVDHVIEDASSSAHQGAGLAIGKHEWSATDKKGIRIGRADVVALAPRPMELEGSIPNRLEFGTDIMPFHPSLSDLSPVGKLDKAAPLYFAVAGEQSIIVAESDDHQPQDHAWLLRLIQSQADLFGGEEDGDEEPDSGVLDFETPTEFDAEVEQGADE